MNSRECHTGRQAQCEVLQVLHDLLQALREQLARVQAEVCAAMPVACGGNGKQSNSAPCIVSLTGRAHIPIIPTLSGWLLEYPVVYLATPENAAAMSDVLSSQSLRLYSVVAPSCMQQVGSCFCEPNQTRHLPPSTALLHTVLLWTALYTPTGKPSAHVRQVGPKSKTVHRAYEGNCGCRQPCCTGLQLWGQIQLT